MSDNFSYIQSYLGFSTSEKLSQESFQKVFKLLKDTIKKNKSTFSEGHKIYSVEDDSNKFPKLAPESKPMTKWERFANEKGIRKTNKGRKVFNEETQDWEFRYGSKSIQNQKIASGIVEGKKTPSQLKREKQQRIDKNRKQQEKNKERIRQIKK